MVTHEQYEELMRLCKKLREKTKKFHTIENYKKSIDYYHNVVEEYFYNLYDSNKYWENKLHSLTDNDFIEGKIKVVRLPRYEKLNDERFIKATMGSINLEDYTVTKGYNLPRKNFSIVVADHNKLRKYNIKSVMSWIGEVEEAYKKPLAEIDPETLPVYSDKILNAGFNQREFKWCVEVLLKDYGVDSKKREEYFNAYINNLTKNIVKKTDEDIYSNKVADTLDGAVRKVLATTYTSGERFIRRYTNARTQVIISLALLGVALDEFQYLDESDFNPKGMMEDGVLTIRNPELGTRTIEIPLGLKLTMNEYLAMAHTKKTDGALILNTRADDGTFHRVTKREIRKRLLQYEDADGVPDLINKGRTLHFMDLLRDYEREHGKKPEKTHYSDKDFLNMLVANMRRYGILHSDGFLTNEDMKLIKYQYYRFYTRFTGKV